jgi:hypothetical protein
MPKKDRQTNTPNDWVPCEPGALLDVAAQQSAMSRRAAMSKLSYAVIAVAATGTSAAVYLASGNQPTTPVRDGSSNRSLTTTPVASISCKKVVCLLPEYLNSEIKDESLLASIENHLGYCKSCCDERDRLQA